ncbi:tetratricopeptide repeat protein [Massilia arenosa]|uniref:Tetratricopeptide repeat protein n=1 Tax=Zemynaea arenosa TaxID=2561931 RepID=A0A4Y9SPB0_9BURK|nr:tetratricopeptide repeat protein [Massilia arenosa]TFW28428.1 tetratricopeptide repeat protein [Massilia arenosa]
MKTAFTIVTLSALLSACAVAPPQQSAPPAPQAAAADASSVDGDATAQSEEKAADEKLPDVQLTSDMLFRLLKAELEYQNGDWQSSYIALLSAAQQTRDPRLARRAAEMALAAKQPAESLAAVRLWRELAPESDEANQYYLGLAVMADDLSEVETIFAEKLAAMPPGARGPMLYQIQQLLQRARDKQQGAQVVEHLAEPYKDSFEGHIVLSQAAATRADNDKAVAEAKAALALKPDSELAVLALAQVTNGDEEVGRLLSAFLAEHPKAREVRAAYARVLVNARQYEQARHEFELLLEGQPDNLGTLYALGIMSLQVNDRGAAEKHLSHFMEVLDKRPGDERDPTRVLLMLSQIAEERGDFKGAYAWLDKLDAGTPQAVFQSRLKRAQLQGKQGELAAAKKTLDSVETDDGEEKAQVAMTYGQILRDAGKFDAAYKVLDTAAKHFPGNPDVLYDYALAAERVGKVELMETTLREVIAQAPENHHAYNALGYSLAERNVRLDEARRLIDKALAMAPEDPFIMDSKGWLEYRLGNLEGAEAMLRKAYALRSDAEIAVHLGEVLWKAGKRADAQKLLREARAKDPKNDALRSTLARLNLKL